LTFVRDEKDKFAVPRGWRDAWEEGGGGAAGLTFDGATNGFVGCEAYQERYDRMFFKVGGWGVEEAEVVGREELEGGGWISDHYGLFVKFRRLEVARTRLTFRRLFGGGGGTVRGCGNM
jgi:hypothetical protein